MTEEMIQNACKAAGWRIKHSGPDSFGAATVWMNGVPVIVKLADDDGDSRLLQVACKIDLFFNYDMHKDGHEIVTAFHDSERGHSHSEPLGTEPLRAARMAVLRCAAMIGGGDGMSTDSEFLELAARGSQ